MAYKERVTEFPAAVRFTAEGQNIEGLYAGTEIIPGKEGKKDIIAHVFLLVEFNGATFLKSKQPANCVKGERVSVTGQRLDRALTTDDIGHKVKVTFDGREKEGRNGNNPAKLYTVEVDDAA
jgi:hypothetical protein